MNHPTSCVQSRRVLRFGLLGLEKVASNDIRMMIFTASTSTATYPVVLVES